MKLHQGSKGSAGGLLTGREVPVQVLVRFLQVGYDEPGRCACSMGVRDQPGALLERHMLGFVGVCIQPYG